MLDKLSLKQKILLLSALVIMALLVLGVSALTQLQRFNGGVTDSFQLVENRVNVLMAVEQAHVHFKVQVQEWKNILIRGNNPDQFAKYSKQFLAESDQVQSLLAQAITHARSAGLDPTALMQVKEEHAKLGEAYSAALQQFNTDDAETGKKVDVLVRGVDRSASEGLEALAFATEQALMEEMKTTIADIARQYDAASNLFLIIMAVAGAVIIGVMLLVFVDLFRTLGGEPAYAATIVRQVAEGKLNLRVDLRQGDKHSLLAAIADMAQRLRQVISDVRRSADELSSASEQVNATAQALAKGASVQAASVEETSASMEQMSSSISQNSENAKVTDSIAQKAAQDAQHGGSAVNETVEAMKKIAERVSVIDDIAYQTNLLALNAAIEAGRAGEHGRGFAVVASEVRKLAERSQVAAQEIGQLAGDSVQRAELAGNLLMEMVPSISRTADLVQEIAAASTEQNSGVNQINAAIGQVSQTMQQNAAASEELSSTAEEMNTQANQLQETVRYFRLDHTAVDWQAA